MAAKKHRVKRANYVKHLLKVEKERDEYIKKRIKRQRADRDEEDPMVAAREAMEGTARSKKRRVERDAANEERAEAGVTTAGAHASTDAKQEKQLAEVSHEVAAVASAGFFKAPAVPAPATTAAASEKMAEKAEEETSPAKAATGKRTLKKKY